VHRNTYVNAPRCLAPTLELRAGWPLPAGQYWRRGYVESGLPAVAEERCFAAEVRFLRFPTLHRSRRFVAPPGRRGSPRLPPTNLNSGSSAAHRSRRSRFQARSEPPDRLPGSRSHRLLPGAGGGSPPMTFEQAIRSFELYLRAERNASPHTRRAYLSDLRQFAESLGTACGPEAVRVEDVRAFLAERHRSQSPTTLGRKLAALRSFFRFLVREGQREADPSSPRAPRCQAAAESPGRRRLSPSRGGAGRGTPSRRALGQGRASSRGSRRAAQSGAGRAPLRGRDQGRRAGGARLARHRPAPGRGAGLGQGGRSGWCRPLLAAPARVRSAAASVLAELLSPLRPGGEAAP
jgi:hypothetical protein